MCRDGGGKGVGGLLYCFMHKNSTVLCAPYVISVTVEYWSCVDCSQRSLQTRKCPGATNKPCTSSNWAGVLFFLFSFSPHSIPLNLQAPDAMILLLVCLFLICL